MDYINEKYKYILEFLELISSAYFKGRGIKIHINIPSEDKLNACVKRIGDKEYSIDIYSACLNLNYQIERITERYTADDLKTFYRFEKLGIFDRYDEDTYRDDLNNLFSTIILLHIFWHEVGHIEAGYVDRKQNYLEFDSDEKGCYSKQEQEMVADWLSAKQVFILLYSTAIHSKVSDMNALIKSIQNLIMLYWISLTIEFQIFDSNHTKPIDDFSSLTHPHPAVRLYYSLEAMAEAVVDILDFNGIDDDIAQECMQVIIGDIYILIMSFMGITKSPIDVKKYDKKVIECYKTLREIPYTDDYEKNDFLHLEPLSELSLKIINDFFESDISLTTE